ncbi:MAG: peptide ABC transporter substrate-binding protein [Anaerolineales bacterium]|nr:peptide ABC transporter substrate-binding protein [Anaerolineales bacterium]
MRNSKMLFRILVAVVALSLVLAACGPGPSTTPEAPGDATEVLTDEAPAGRSVATFIYTQEFDTLSPLYTDMWFAWTTWQLFLNWAWEYDENNEAFPVLVTEIPSIDNGGISADGMTITMQLRDDLTWSDGEPLTSDDFVFTWEMAVSPTNAVTSSYPYSEIDSVEAPDPQTVVVNFSYPFAPWLATLWHGILPAHVLRPIYEAEGTIDNADWLRNPTVGYGPYVFDEWESGSYVRFVRNENYWGEPANIDEIFIRFVPDDASQVAALQAGDADLGTFPAYSDVPTLQNAGLEIVIQPNGYNEGLFLLVSAERGHPALLDVNVRLAIAMGIDRESINRDLLLGLTRAPASFWDAMPYYNDPPVDLYPYDPEGARQLLDAAGWIDTNDDGVRDKDGVELEIDYGTNIREIRQDVQAVIQQQLAEIGIAVNLFSSDDDIFFASYGEGGPAAIGDYDLMEWSDGPLFPDPDVYYWLCDEIPTDEYPAGSNWFFLCDEELDGLIQLQASQVNPEERQQTISQINQLFHDQVYWIGLWQDPDVWIVSPRLVNVSFSGVTPLFSIAEWEMVEP